MNIPPCPVPINQDGSIDQPYFYYQKTDHEIWNFLFVRQIELLKNKICPEFIEGLTKLPFNEYSVPNVEKVSNKLKKLSNFELVSVGGLISSQQFFNHLANRKFTVGWFVRKKEQVDYLEEPDLFHDLFGHVPLLTNPTYANFIQHVGLIGNQINTRFKNDPDKAELISNALLRLYWFTVEFGLIQSPNQELKIYGAGISSSFSEVPHSLYNQEVNRIALDSIERVVRTNYFIDKMQQLYFVIPSFDFLFDIFSQNDLIDQIITARQKPMYKPSIILETDKLINYSHE